MAYLILIYSNAAGRSSTKNCFLKVQQFRSKSDNMKKFVGKMSWYFITR